MTPTWILDILAAVMLAVAAVSAARIAVARPRGSGAVFVDGDVAHLLMAVAMAGMLAPSLHTLPSTVWEVIFGALTAWFAFRGVRDARVSGIRALAGGQGAPHLVHSASMLYMFLSTTSMAGMAGMSGMNELPGSSGSTMLTLDDPTLAFIFALLLIGYSTWDLDQLSGRRYRLTGPRLSLAGLSAERAPGPPGDGSRDAAFAGSRPAGTAAGTGGGSGLTGGAVTAAAAPNRASGELLLSPAVTVACRVTMGVVMAFILLIAI